MKLFVAELRVRWACWRNKNLKRYTKEKQGFMLALGTATGSFMDNTFKVQKIYYQVNGNGRTG